MGEIAQMMLDGTLDSFTGEYLGPGPGYPRTADRSLPWEGRRKPKPATPTGSLPPSLGGDQMVGKRVRASVRISGVWRTADGEITEYAKARDFKGYVGYRFVRKSNSGNPVIHEIRFSHILQIL